MKTLLASLAIAVMPHLGAAQDSPLTGAQFTFDKQSSIEKIDLLRKCDWKKWQLNGTWTFNGAQISGGDIKDAGRVMIGPSDLTVPDEYDLSITVTRLSGDDGIATAFPTPGGGRGLLMLDYNHGQIGCGLAFVNGAAPDVSGYGITGALLKKGMARTFVLMIRREGLVIQLDGKDYLGKKVSWSTVTVTAAGDRPDQKGFCLSTWKSQIAVSQYRISYPIAAPEAKH
jgi:hypothetical protein